MYVCILPSYTLTDTHSPPKQKNVEHKHSFLLKGQGGTITTVTITTTPTALPLLLCLRLLLRPWLWYPRNGARRRLLVDGVGRILGLGDGFGEGGAGRAIERRHRENNGSRKKSGQRMSWLVDRSIGRLLSLGQCSSHCPEWIGATEEILAYIHTYIRCFPSHLPTNSIESSAAPMSVQGKRLV